MKIIDDDLIDRLVGEAQASPRLRRNFNIHDSYEDPCQRLLNAVEPGSYIRPHRHLEPPKSETFVLLRGRIALLVFSGEGAVENQIVLGAGANCADIPAGTWHGLIALDSGSVFFETKPGPYIPLSDKDWAPWAPAEGTPEAAAYLRELQKTVESGLLTTDH
ncbi:hypothetical protein DESUT3_24530 [Desulfuromonas versatilis]|uniref:Cupin fold metalloprotein WbuC cupin domain-containing protein n=1 Tax=Desulfuromonas versatilis TaxID=2802975 RepID=A0ABM8HSV3_9BACT|nr:WbuC family cupin fold metalloprotein [Desulfuromonas versatilis]BCR05384.1 hypothetical protein DESUT3_24530 [Desulfuromonas versatilis]